MFLVENALKEVMEFSNNSLKKEPILKNNPRQLWKKEKVGEDGLFTLRSPQTQKYLTLSSKYSCNSTLEVFCLDGTYYLISYLLSYMSASYHQDNPKNKLPKQSVHASFDHLVIWFWPPLMK